MICETTAAALPQREAFDKSKDCPVDRARELMEQARHASCGQCVLCREGTAQVHEIMKDAATGAGQDEDIALMDELLTLIHSSAGCEMAVEAAGESLTLLRNYPEQWEQHIGRKRCPSLVCKAYYTMHVSPASCTGCGECVKVCPQNAIAGGEGLIHVIDNKLCDRCLACVAACPAGAITKAGAVKPKGPAQPVPVGSFEEEGGGRRRRRRG